MAIFMDQYYSRIWYFSSKLDPWNELGQILTMYGQMLVVLVGLFIILTSFYEYKWAKI